jgi:TP901 family phage tail tape measure protein
MAKEVKFTVRLNVDGKEQVVTATSTVHDLQRAVDSAKGSAVKLRESLINANQTIQMMQNAINAFSQLSGALGNLTEESNSFSSAMKAANTMAGKDAAGFDKLKGQVAELSKTVPMARDALANGLYQVISNGVPEDNWINYLETSARSAVGGIADVGEVVKVTSTIIKNYGLEWDAAQDIQDKIQLTAKNGVTSFEQLAAALPSVTGQAAQLGVSFTEMLAVMSTLTGVTGNTAEVATQLASVLTALTKESSKSQKMAEAMGISFNAASIKAAGGFRNFLMELDKTITAYTAKTGELKESVYAKLFGRAEALRLVNGLTGQLAEKFDENIKLLDNSAGTMAKAYDDMASTGASQLQMLKNAWGQYTDYIAGTVSSIQPILNFGSQIGMSLLGVTSLVKAFSQLHIAQALASKSMYRTIAVYALFGTNSRRVAAATHVMANSFRSAATKAVALKIAIRGLMAATGIGIALTALGVVVAKLAGSFDGVTDAAAGAADGLEDFGQSADTVKQAYDNTLESTYSDLMGKYEQLKEGWKALSKEQEKIAWIKNNQSAFEELKLKISNVSDAENIFSGNTDAVVEAFTRRAKAAARMAQLTELYRKQIALADEYAATQTAIQDDANKNARHAKAGDEIKDQTYRNSRYGSVDNGGKWRFSEEGAKLYSGTNVSSSPALKAIEKRMQANEAETKKVEAQFAAEQAEANKPISSSKVTSGGSGSDSKKDKSGKKDLSLVENAKSYKDLANNVAYYQQEIEKADKSDVVKIQSLTHAKKAAEDAVAAFKMLQDGMELPDDLKSLDDYDKKLSYLRKQKQSASKEAIAGIDEEIRKTEEARQTLEDTTVAALRDDEIRSYDQLNAKLSYYNRLLNSGDEAQREFAQKGINSLNKLQEAWDQTREEMSLPATTDNLKDIDAAISFYSQRQQKEDADNIMQTQRIIDDLTAKKRTLQLSTEIPGMQREIANVNSLDGREQTIKIRSIGFDELKKRIKELNDLMADTRNPVTDSQRKEIEAMIDVYQSWQRQCISSFSTLQNGWNAIKGIGSGVESITSALEGNGNAWQTVTGIVDGFIQLYEGIQTIVGIIELLTTVTAAHTAAKTAEGVATGVTAGATVAAATTEEAAAAAAIPIIAANKLATASYMELASAMYFAAHAYIPFAGFGIAAGFTAAAVAMVQAIGITPFASGAVVSGPTLALVGEYAGAGSNPEVIAPLDKLRTMIDTGDSGISGKVRFEIEGRKLVGVIEKEYNHKRRS